MLVLVLVLVVDYLIDLFSRYIISIYVTNYIYIYLSISICFSMNIELSVARGHVVLTLPLPHLSSR